MTTILLPVLKHLWVHVSLDDAALHTRHLLVVLSGAVDHFRQLQQQLRPTKGGQLNGGKPYIIFFIIINKIVYL